MPESIPGLFIGCVLSNFIGGYGLTDMIFGSLATIIAAIMTRKSPNIYLAAFWPVFWNAIIIGAMLHYLLEVPLLATCLYVGVGEAGACYVVGVPLMKVLEGRKIISRV